MKKSEIKFAIELDENNLPEKIQWEATDSGIDGAIAAKSIMLSVWDPTENNTLRIDLWTKDMMVDEMADFFYQTMMTMADTYGRATKYADQVEEMKTFAKGFYEKFREKQLKENKAWL